MTETMGLRRPIFAKKVNFPVCMAPMVGLSHVSFRRLVRSYLPAGAVTIWPTEMLSTFKLPQEKVGSTPETRRDPIEDLLVPQILGNEPKPISDSVKILENWGADGIDINMGCPVNKALKHNYGVALMGDAGYAADVVRATVASTAKPVSVKLRAGFDGNKDFLTKFVRGLESAGASYLTIHPRTAEQKRRGRADWVQIRELRESVNVPVIGNGDIQVADDVFRMLLETGCDMTMAGRALTARPWMLWQIGERLGFPPPVGREGCAPNGEREEALEYGRALLAMCDYVESDFGGDLGLRKLRFFIRTGSVWLDFGNSLYALAMKHKTIGDVRLAIAEFFKNDLRLVQRTELRS